MRVYHDRPVALFLRGQRVEPGEPIPVPDKRGKQLLAQGWHRASEPKADKKAESKEKQDG